MQPNQQRTQTKRITEMDALRGLALLGILLVNIFVFHAPLSHYGEFYGKFEGIQATTVELVVGLAGGKFLFIFAFLFGYGIALQQYSHQKAFTTYFTKRMLVLLLFGSLHILLFWFGDILASYALLGLLVMPALKCSNRMLLALSIFFVLFRPLYYLAVVVLEWPMVGMGKPVELPEFINVFQHGSFLKILALRIQEFVAFLPENLVWYIPKTYGLFLVGVYAARIKLFNHITNHKVDYLVAAFFLGATGVAWIFYRPLLFGMFDLASQPLWRPLLITLNVVFETALGASYILGFALAFQKNHLITRMLAKTGRLALSNYLLQSLLCVLLFYGYGLGYYGKLRPTDLVLLSLLIFCINVLFSFFYLQFKSSGPLEYVWRKLIGARSPSKRT